MKIHELKKTITDKSIIVGCNYHTTWQSNKGMRFVLAEIKEDKARLITRNTKKSFWISIDDLIFIKSNYNINKAVRLLKSGTGN